MDKARLTIVPIVPAGPGVRKAAEGSATGGGRGQVFVTRLDPPKDQSQSAHVVEGADASGAAQSWIQLDLFADPPSSIAERLQSVVARRRISVGQLARWWGVNRTTAYKALKRESGPGAKKIARLPESVRRELEAA